MQKLVRRFLNFDDLEADDLEASVYMAILQLKLLFFGKFLVLLYYILLLRQSASLPLLFATVTGLTARKVTVARSWCSKKITVNKPNRKYTQNVFICMYVFVIKNTFGAFELEQSNAIDS